MVVPKFKEFYLPTLKYYENGEIHTISEVSSYLADYFKLNDEELNEKTKKGALRYKDRTTWAVNHLFRAGLLDRKERGKYMISKEGLNVLKKDIDKIDEELLMKYKSFREYKYPEKSDIPSDNEINDTQSPSDRLEQAYDEINDELILNILDEIKAKSSTFFENLVVDLLLKMRYGGFHENAGIVTKQSRGGGIDRLINEDILGLDKIAIQAKRHKNTISSPDLNKFVGVLTGMSINKGVFITTSKFSKGAEEFAKNAPQSVVLIDGKKLAEYMIEFELGVSKESTYHIKKIDTDYFNRDE